jgi:uncharacterized protein (TIGR03437 family)
MCIESTKAEEGTMRIAHRVGLNLFIVWCGFAQSYTVTTIAGGLPRPSTLAAAGSIGSPVGTAVDSAGNVYFFSLNCIFKLEPGGGLTRVAGDYTAGYSGDGGPATDAQLDPPLLLAYGTRFADLGLAVDTAGNVYVPDPVVNRVRRVSTSGTIATVAGNGTVEMPISGEGGPATNASLGGPNHLAFDSGGNLYIAENVGRVRKVTPDGILTTVAGGGFFNGQTGDGGPAVGAYLASAAGIAIDSTGNLYIAEPTSNRVRRVSAAGIITTFAGTGSAGYSGDGGPAFNAQLTEPADLALDASGNLYITDPTHNRIRSVSPAGIITTVAGNGNWGYAGDGGPATSAPLSPEGLAADTAGNLFVADFGSNRIRKINGAGTIDTVAGDGTQDYSGDGGPAINARVSLPGPLAADQAGNLYIADRGNNRVRQVSQDGTIHTIAGNGSPGYSGDGGPAANAEVMPLGLAFDGAGNLYIASVGGVRKLTPDGNIAAVPGTAGSGLPLSPPIVEQTFDPVNNLAADSKGNVYYPLNGVEKFAPDGTITRLTSNAHYPAGIAVDATGDLYYADPVDNFVGIISPSGAFSLFSVNLGNGCQNYGPPSAAQGLAFDASGNLYIGAPQTATLQRIAPAGNVDTIAGNFTFGYSGDGGPATAAQFEYPTSFTADGEGNVYVTDAVDDVIRMLKPAPPAPASVAAVANAASNLAGPVAPGEIVVIYGSGIGPDSLVSCAYGAAGLSDTQLDGTQVSFNGTPARLLYPSATQVAAVVPYSVSGSTTEVGVAYRGGTPVMAPVPVAPSAPALFTADGTGRGQAAASNQDGSLNSAENPVSPGQFVTLYATGEGQTSPAGVDGKPASNPLPQPVLPVSVTIGGQTIQPQYAGGSPGSIAGLLRIDVLVPSGLRPGSAVQVAIQIGSATSQPGVTIAVAAN